MFKKGDIPWNKKEECINDAGYVIIIERNHPFSDKRGRIRKHRVIMEQYLHKYNPNHPALIEIDGINYLRSEWVPHHKNRKRDDNRIENLELMTKLEHVSFHMKGTNHPFYGKHLSLKTRKKISEDKIKKYACGDLKSWNKGKTLEEIFGKIRADEIKEKISKAKKGKSTTWNKDKPLSEEHKRKI